MARDLANVVIEYRYAWWLKHYCQALLCFCALFGTTPDVKRVASAFGRAARWRIVGTTKWQKL